MAKNAAGYEVYQVSKEYADANRGRSTAMPTYNPSQSNSAGRQNYNQQTNNQPQNNPNYVQQQNNQSLAQNTNVDNTATSNIASMQQYVAGSVKTAGYTSRSEAEADIWMKYSQNPDAMNAAYKELDTLYSDKNSGLYNPYKQSTNGVIDNLRSRGIDVPADANDDYWTYALRQYQDVIPGMLSDSSGNITAPSKPSSKASAAKWQRYYREQEAYWLYTASKDEANTKKAESLWGDMQKEMAYYARNGYSYDEALKKVNSNKDYQFLFDADLNASRGYPTQFNRGIGYSQDNLRGVYYCAANGIDLDGADFEYYAVGQRMGKGKQANTLRQSENTYGSANYAPHKRGSTLYDAAIYFGTDHFDDKWFDDNAHIMNDGTDKEKSMYQNALTARDTYNQAQAELAELNDYISKARKAGIGDDAIEKYIRGAFEESSDYSTLRKIAKGIDRGSPVALTDALAFNGIDSFVRQSIYGQRKASHPALPPKATPQVQVTTENAQPEPPVTPEQVVTEDRPFVDFQSDAKQAQDAKQEELTAAIQRGWESGDIKTPEDVKRFSINWRIQNDASEEAPVEEPAASKANGQKPNLPDMSVQPYEEKPKTEHEKAVDEIANATLPRNFAGRHFVEAPTGGEDIPVESLHDLLVKSYSEQPLTGEEAAFVDKWEADNDAIVRVAFGDFANRRPDDSELFSNPLAYDMATNDKYLLASKGQSSVYDALTAINSPEITAVEKTDVLSTIMMDNADAKEAGYDTLDAFYADNPERLEEVNALAQNFTGRLEAKRQAQEAEQQAIRDQAERDAIGCFAAVHDGTATEEQIQAYNYIRNLDVDSQRVSDASWRVEYERVMNDVWSYDDLGQLNYDDSPIFQAAGELSSTGKWSDKYNIAFDGLSGIMERYMQDDLRLATVMGMSLEQFYDKYPEFRVDGQTLLNSAVNEYRQQYMVSADEMAANDTLKEGVGLGWSIVKGLEQTGGDIERGALGFGLMLTEKNMSAVSVENYNSFKAAYGANAEYMYGLAVENRIAQMEETNPDRQYYADLLVTARENGTSLFYLPLNFAAADLRDSIAEVNARLEANDEFMRNNATTAEYDAYKYTRIVGTNTFNMGASAALTAAGTAVGMPQLGALPFFVNTTGNTYADMRSDLATAESPEFSGFVATLAGAVDAATENIGEIFHLAAGAPKLSVYKTLYGGGAKSVFKWLGDTVKHLAKSNLNEIAQETMQDLAGNTVSNIVNAVHQNGFNLDNVFKAIDQSFADTFNPETTYERTVGTLLSTTLFGMMGSFSSNVFNTGEYTADDVPNAPKPLPAEMSYAGGKLNSSIFAEGEIADWNNQQKAKAADIAAIGTQNAGNPTVDVDIEAANLLGDASGAVAENDAVKSVDYVRDLRREAAGRDIQTPSVDIDMDEMNANNDAILAENKKIAERDRAMVDVEGTAVEPETQQKEAPAQDDGFQPKAEYDSLADYIADRNAYNQEKFIDLICTDNESAQRFISEKTDEFVAQAMGKADSPMNSADVAKAKDAKAKCEAGVKDAQGKVDALQQQCDTLAAQIADANKNAGTAEGAARIANMLKEFKSLRSKLGAAKGNLTQAQNRLADAETNLNNLETEAFKAVRQKAHDDAVTYYNTIKEKYTAQQQQRQQEAQSKAIADLEADMRENPSNPAIRRAKNDVNLNQAIVDDAQAEVDANEQRIEELNNQLNEVKQQLQQAQSNNAPSDQIAALYNKMHSLVGEANTAVNKRNGLAKNLADAQKALAESNTKLDDVVHASAESAYKRGYTAEDFVAERERRYLDNERKAIMHEADGVKPAAKSDTVTAQTAEADILDDVNYVPDDADYIPDMPNYDEQAEQQYLDDESAGMQNEMDYAAQNGENNGQPIAQSESATPVAEQVQSEPAPAQPANAPAANNEQTAPSAPVLSNGTGELGRTQFSTKQVPKSNMSDGAKKYLQDNGLYNKDSNKAQIDRANQRISTEFDGDMARAGENLVAISEHSPQDLLSADNQAMFCLLMADAVARNDEDAQERLGSAYDKLGTMLGQGLQARVAFRMMQPGAQLKMLEKQLADAQAKHGNRVRGDLGISEELRNEYMKAKTADERNAVIDKIVAENATKIDASVGDILNTWRYTAMLLNPKTHSRNMFGNGVMAAMTFVRNRLSGAIQSSQWFKDKYGADAQQRVNLIKKEYRNAADRVFTAAGKKMLKGEGDKFTKSLASRIESERSRTQFKGHELEFLKACSEFNGKLLDNEDMWFKNRYFKSAVASYLQSHGITISENMTEDEMMKNPDIRAAMQFGYDEAFFNTFNNMNAMTSLMSQMTKPTGKDYKLDKAKKFAGFVLNTQMPFKNVPFNIVARSVDYSPVGLIKSLTYDVGLMKEGKITPAQMVDRFAAGLTGTGLYAAGIIGYAMGVITPGIDKDDEGYYDKDTGSQPFSINIGGWSETLDFGGPATIALMTGATLGELLFGDGYDDDSSVTIPKKVEAVLEALTHMLDPMTEMTVLQNINDIRNAEFGAETLMTAVAGTAMQFYPTLLSQIERFLNGSASGYGFNTRQSTRQEDERINGLPKSWQKVMNKNVVNRMLGVPELLDAMGLRDKTYYVDRFGNRDAGGFWGELLDTFVNPGYVSKKVSNSATEFVDKALQYTNGNEKVIFDSMENNYKTTSFKPTADENKERLLSYKNKSGETVYTMKDADYEQASIEYGKNGLAAFDELNKMHILESGAIQPDYVEEITKYVAGAAKDNAFFGTPFDARKVAEEAVAEALKKQNAGERKAYADTASAIVTGMAVDGVDAGEVVNYYNSLDNDAQKAFRQSLTYSVKPQYATAYDRGDMTTVNNMEMYLVTYFGYDYSTFNKWVIK